MPKINTRVTFDKVKAAALIKAVSDDALTIMGNQALQDVGQIAVLLIVTGMQKMGSFACVGILRMLSICGTEMLCMAILGAERMVLRS